MEEQLQELLYSYWHFRIIDYHPTKPWYVSFVAVSPTHEWFVWNELVLKHDRATTFDLRTIIREESLLEEDEEFNRRTLIDPLAKEKQPNSGFSVFEDLSRGEEGLRRCEGADTKNSANQGRQNVRRRLNNAVKCGRPFNNIIKFERGSQNEDIQGDDRYGNYLPTLWFFDNCKVHIEHFSNWRTIEWKTEQAKAEHDAKRLMEKWSDFCRNIEFLASMDPVWYEMKQSDYEPRQFFRGRA